MNSSSPFANPSNPRTVPNRGTTPGVNGNFWNFADLPPEGDGQPFPLACVAPEIAEFVIQAAEAAAVPVSMAAATALGVVAASLGSGLELQDEGSRTTRGNLYTIISVPSAGGKDAIFNEVAGVFTHLHSETRNLWEKEYKPGLATDLIVARERRNTMRTCFKNAASDETRAHYRAALLTAEGECARLERELQRCPVLCVTDPTRVGMAMLLEHQRGEACAIMTPEARGSVATALGRSPENLSLFCSAFSGTLYEDLRASRAPVCLKRPCLSMLWMMQPDVLSKLLDNEEVAESGLMPRFLVFQCGDPPVPELDRRPRVATGVKNAWWTLIRDLIGGFRLREAEPAVINPSDEALREFRIFRKELAERMAAGGGLGDLVIFVRRWEEQAKRIAVVLHAGEHGKNAAEHELSAATARNAVAIARWFGDQQLELFHSRRFAWLRTKAEKLHKTLMRHPGRQATVGGLAKSHCWKKEDVLHLAGLFPDLLQAVETPAGTRGKPTTRVFAV